MPSCCLETFSMHENSVGFAVDILVFLLNSTDSRIWNKPQEVKSIIINEKIFTNVNCFCASLLCTQIHTPCHPSMRALSNKILKQMIGQMANCYSFAWINDLGRSVTPLFLSTDHFLYRFSTFSEKIKKIYPLKCVNQSLRRLRTEEFPNLPNFI